MNKVFRNKKFLIKVISAISAAAIVTGGIAFYLSKDTRVLASAMAEGKEVPQYLDSISAINYATILGRATDFGIVANDFEQITHMETTFAVNTFSNSSGQVNEVDFITNSAQFMVGRIGTGKIKFGSSQTARSYNIEASTPVFTNFQSEWDSGRIFNDTDANTSFFYFDNAQSSWTGTDARPVYTVIKDQSAINANINNVISNATTSSDYISSRANDPAYALDYTQYLRLESLSRPEYDPMDPNSGDINYANRFYIDIDKAEFVNRVVYINVDENLARVMSCSEGLCIIKDPSTVVCFNIEPGISNTEDGGLILNRLDVSEDGGNNFCWSVTASQGNSTNTQSTGSVGRDNDALYNNADVDRMINQKIIINVRSDSQNIQLDAIAGTTLIPNPSSIANVKGSSTGWVVAGGKLRNAGGEWHYIYQGGSQDLINQDTGNEIHFALHKNFTSDNGATTDNSVLINEGQFTFNLYDLGKQTDPAFFDGITPASATNSPVNADNKATGNVQFPTMSGFTSGDYYYLITENPNQNSPYEDDSITNSTGYIKIHLNVSEGTPADTFTVHYAYYLNANDTTPYREEENVVMMGVQFDLGGFFNFVQPTGSISIDKSVLGVIDIPDNYVAPVYVQSGNTYYGVDANGDLITSQDPIINNVHPGSTYVLRGLPLNKTYSVREASHPAITDYSFVSVTGENSYITLNNSNPNSTVSLQNTYKKNNISNVLYLAKIGSDTHQLLEGASFTLEYSGQEDLTGVNISGVTGMQRNGSSFAFTTVDSANVSFIGLPNGSYTLTETAAPSGYSTVAPVSFTLNDQQLIFDGTAPSYALFDSNTHILTITDQSNLGKLKIDKTIAMDSRFNGTVTKADLGTIEFSISGPASFNNGYPLVVSLNAFDLVSGSYVFEQDVPAGTYTITEIRNGANSWYSCVTTVGSAETNAANVNVEINKTGSASFVNTYSPTTGSLVITKTVYGITDIASVDPITFEITAPSGSNLTTGSVTLDRDWSSNGWTKNGNTYTYVFSNVTPGEYQIRETTTGANSSYTCTVVPNSAISTANVYAGDIPIVPATFTNTYSRVTGTVEIDKVIAGGGTELAGAQLQLTSTTDANMSGCSVTGGGQSTAFVSRDLITFTSGTAPTSIAGLPQGRYKLHENAAPAGYLVSTDIFFTVDEYGNVAGDEVSTSSGHAVITMEDKAITVEISKIAVGGTQEVQGAEITITGAGNVDLTNCTVTQGNASILRNPGEDANVIRFISGSEVTTISGLPAGTYTMHEVTPPGGYRLATDITFTVAADGTVTGGTAVSASPVAGVNARITMEDELATGLVISKVHVAGSGYEELPGATLTLSAVDSNNQPIDLSSYTLSDDEDCGGENVTYINGAIQYVSTDKPAMIENLPNGTYTLHEVTPPSNYSVSTDIVFTMNNGVATAVTVQGSNSVGENKITMVDAGTGTTDVVLSKVEVAADGSYTELPGAVLTLTAVDENSADIDLTSYEISGGGTRDNTTYTGTGIRYTSGSTPTTIAGLPNGTYTLHEDTSPIGYSVSTDIVFTLNEGVVTPVTVNGSNSINTDTHTVTMVDAANTVDISKIAVGGGSELQGATIEITCNDSSINLINVQVSGGATDISQTASKISFKTGGSVTTLRRLPAGTYTMTEVTPPDRYQVTTAITFTVNADGTVTGGEVTAATNNSNARVTMSDALIEVDFSKVEIGTTDELPGASITITGPAGADLTTCTVSGANGVTKTGNTISYISAGQAATITGLPDGTYTMTETAAPLIYDDVAHTYTQYEIATDITFRIEDGKVYRGNTEVTPLTTGANPVIVMEDDVASVTNETGTVDISKTDASGLNELAGAGITITSLSNTNMLGCTVTGGASNLNITASSISYTTTGTSHVTISGLPAGNYRMTEVTPPYGYQVATYIDFTVGPDGSISGNIGVTAATNSDNARVTMADALTVVDISKKRVNGTSEIPGAEITITGPALPEEAYANFVSTNATRNGNVITFTSGDAPTTLQGLPAGTYTLHELTPPGGYQVATDITFTINSDGSVSGGDATANSLGHAQVTLYDSAYTDITLSKVEIAGSGYQELPGAVLTLTAADSNGRQIDISGCVLSGGGTRDNSYTGLGIRYESGSTPTSIADLPDGRYTLHENSAPNSRYSVSTDIVFDLYNGSVTAVTVEGSNSVNANNNTVTMVDEMAVTTDITLNKVEMADDGSYTELPGAVLTLTAVDGNNNPINISNCTITGGGSRDNSYSGSGIRYTSGGLPTDVHGLPNGTYTLHEDSAPNSNYSVSTDIVFTLNNGTVTAVSVRGDNSINGNTITMVDGPATTPPVDQCTLILIKDVESNGAPVPQTYTFNVLSGDTYYGLDDNGGLITSATPIPISVAYGNEVSLSGLPNGTYTVNEVRDGAEVQGYNLNVEGETDYTLDDSDPSTMVARCTITNTYTSTAPTTGSLTIIKNIGDGAPTSAYAMDYTFTVTGPNGYSADVVIHGAGSETVTGLVPGTYTVTEQASTATIGGYQWTATGDGVATVNVVAGNTPSVVTITNSYNETTAATSATTSETTVETTAATTEATTESTVQSSETAAPSETTATTTEVTTSVIITAIDVNISKQDIAGAEIDGAVLTITNAPDNNVNFLEAGVTAMQNGLPAAGLEVTADKLQFTTVASSQALIHNLPVGKYVLTETIAPRGYLIAESISFEVRNDGTLWVAGTPQDQLVERIVMRDLADPTVGQEAERTTPVVNSVSINGITITPDHYTVNSDGTVTIDEEYARVLGVGRHQIQVTFSDGTTRMLYITVNSDGSVVQTGESRVSASSIMAIVMLAAGGMVFSVRRRLIIREEK